MKIIIISILFLFSISCREEEKPVEKPKTENLIDSTKNEYKEWYPGRKQVKIEGKYTDDKRRQGLWSFFDPNGMEMSTTHYENGLREGFSIVKYPSGAVHYSGEYRNDKMFGLWKFYDEEGKEVASKKY